MIDNHIGEIIRASSVYETSAWGKTDQADFLNQAILVSTEKSAANVLEQIYLIEGKMGRQHQEKWGPRIIDIDIIFHGSEIIQTESLKVPHPEFSNRNFVLDPLAELVPHFVDPITKKTIIELKNICSDNSAVNRLPSN